MMTNNGFIGKYLEIYHGAGEYDFVFNVTEYDSNDDQYYADGIIRKGADYMEVYCGPEFEIYKNDVVTVFNTKEELYAQVLTRFDEMLDDTIGLTIFK